ncbi:PREDICTED: BMP/retinoic acid-inducible neural-specific protein 2 [Nanorana parkeri]|uniref:BMP/retinoic acid-inducible neural-specific protein 2 n=1 Tax=Nanorana parkeri TaxID=125878 RepID=UPI000854E2B9|nr:PREDICTED: BMP/retinoic acid-inducible neural-specific protein 2 [Nanorana parkeri]
MRWHLYTRSDWAWLVLTWLSVMLCLASATATISRQHGSATSTGQSSLDWLLSNRGPFHRAQQYVDFAERYQQGYTTRYRVHREFGRWKVKNMALESKEFPNLTLAPEFVRTIRQLGRRPSAAQITENLIKKYGTHILLSAVLGGEESLTMFVDKGRLKRDAGVRGNNSSPTLDTLHQLAASYFMDRESALRQLHHIQITTGAIKVTETRTGPLGCSNYDNLDSVSSVLVMGPESKVQLLGLQALLPQYLQVRFVRAALSYISCNSQGRMECQGGECWCHCDPAYPQCNCPAEDIHILEKSLTQTQEQASGQNKEFEESAEFRAFMKNLPTDRFLNITTISRLWNADLHLTRRYEQLRAGFKQLLTKSQRQMRRLINLSKHCLRQPQYTLLREKSVSYWWHRIQSLLYCSASLVPGTFLEASHSCTCTFQHPNCQANIPCIQGPGPLCSLCSTVLHAQCASCNPGYTLSAQGLCVPSVPESSEPFLGTEGSLQDLEVKYLLLKQDGRLRAPAFFISGDLRLGMWFQMGGRKRMLLTCKSNKHWPRQLHMLLGLSMRLCLAGNGTRDPQVTVYVNPFGGSHSESWLLPAGEQGYPSWEKTWDMEGGDRCQNWTLILGHRWRSFFETVHFYMRSNPLEEEGEEDSAEWTDKQTLDDKLGDPEYVRIDGLHAFGYSVPFDPEAIRGLAQKLEQPGSREGALMEMQELRKRVNFLSPPGARKLDLFNCLLRHRLKMSSNEVGRIQAQLSVFSSQLPNGSTYETTKLCS